MTADNTSEQEDQELKDQELKGQVEEAAGKIFGDDDLVAHGKADQVAARAKQAATQAGEAARHVGQRVKDAALRKIGELHEQLHEAAADAGGSAENENTKLERPTNEGGGEGLPRP